MTPETTDTFTAAATENSNPGYAGIEFWPDMTEYTKKYPVDFVYPDNSQAYFFSSSDEETVDLHFKWMQQYGIDGVFIQRFISSITSQAIGKVLKHAVKAAKKYNRAFSIMYDCSGLSTEADIYKVLNDWKIINAKSVFPIRLYVLPIFTITENR
ncbi:MAG: hypothetical protein V8R52_07295 [Coprobacter fastidiosus]